MACGASNGMRGIPNDPELEQSIESKLRLTVGDLKTFSPGKDLEAVKPSRSLQYCRSVLS